MTAAQALARHGRAWFEPEQEGRVEALRRCCTEDIVFVQGTETSHGLEEVASMIGSFSSSAPAPAGEAAPSQGREQGRTGANGVGVDVVTSIEEMGSFFRYSFVWTLPDGTRSAGTDFCEVAEDGRMKLITVWPANDDFPLPDAPPARLTRARLAPMAKASTKRAIERLRKLCLALPEVEEKPFGGHTAPAFRVRDKLFVMTAEDGTWMNLKGAPGVQQALVASDPDKFFVPKYTGKNGWIGARLDVDQDWDELAELVEEAWRRTAPKRTVVQHDAANG